MSNVVSSSLDSIEAGAPEGKITPAMVAAGVPHLLKFTRDDDESEVVARMFQSMWAAHLRSENG